MDCKKISELLTDYIEGELPPDERASVEAHLQGCESCRREVEKLAACHAKLRQSLNLAAGSVDPPPDTLPVIKRRAGIAEENSKEGIFGQHPALAGAIISFLAVFMTLFTLLPFLAAGANPPPDAPAMVSDDAGGVYLYWRIDDIEYEQHIDAVGNLLWGEGGREITGGSPSFDISSGMDNAQDSPYYNQRIGSITFWYDGETVYVQKGNADEEHAWFGEKTEVYKDPAFSTTGYSNIISDGAGGVIIVSRATEGSKISSAYSVYAQRIDANGNRLWGEGGLEVQRISSAPTALIIAGASILASVLLVIWLWRGSRIAKFIIPVLSLALFYTGIRSIW